MDHPPGARPTPVTPRASTRPPTVLHLAAPADADSLPAHRVSALTRRVRRTRAAGWVRGLSRGSRTVVEVLLGLVLPPVAGFAVYLPLARWAPGVLSAWFWVLFAAMAATTAMIVVEVARAHRFPEPPLDRDVADDALPTLATVVAAYLPNEQDTIEDALRAHLAIDYPGDRHVVVLAYNTPGPLAVEERLAAWARRERRLVVLEVHDSTSKVHNIEAALRLVDGEVDVVGIFDADHHPDPAGARRVARWLSGAAGERRFDVVQGQCVIRNLDDGLVARTVAAEFGTLYAVAHPGRTIVNDFGIFGGSNGWWRAPVIRRLRLDGRMLTEDIDVTVRALASGVRLGTDPRIISTELAPATWGALWRQRLRWSQGWLEVSLRHLRPLLATRGLSGVQRRGVAFLLGWRVVHPWLAVQVLPVVAAVALASTQPVHPFLPFFLAAGLAMNWTPLLQAVAANRLAAPSVAGRPRLFASFAVVSVLFYAEAKMVANRAAVVRHLCGVHTWDVTTRPPRRPAVGAAAARPVRTDVPAGDLVGAGSGA